MDKRLFLVKPPEQASLAKCTALQKNCQSLAHPLPLDFDLTRVGDGGARWRSLGYLHSTKLNSRRYQFKLLSIQMQCAGDKCGAELY